MRISEQQHGAVTVIQPAGSLSGNDVEEARNRLLETLKATHGRFVLDASKIAFVDGAGLEMLLDVTDQMNRIGRALKLCGTSEIVCEAMNLTGLAPAFEFFGDANTAVRSFL